MKKNQIFIKCGTEYKEMTKELLEACDLEGEIEKKFETKSSLIDNSEAEVDCFYSPDSVEKQNSEFGLYNMRIGIKPNLVGSLLGWHHPSGGSRRNRRIPSGKRVFQPGHHGRLLGRR